MFDGLRIFHLEGVNDMQDVGVPVPAEQHRGERMSYAEVDAPNVSPVRRQRRECRLSYVLFRRQKDAAFAEQRCTVGSGLALVRQIAVDDLATVICRTSARPEPTV